ncbi:MAG: cytochrome-c peroxidase [Chitinophagales bacterium]
MRKTTWMILLAMLLLSMTVWQRRPVKLLYPKYFPPPVVVLQQPITAAGIALGKKLFYDPVLSADSSISCASCHSPFNAFAHTDHARSHGIHDSIGTRNAPALMNLAWQPMMMWDGAINHIEVQALAPIHHPAEMASSLQEVTQRLQRMADYRLLFARAFPDSGITGQHVLQALAQFELTLISADSKYDSVRRHQAQFAAIEEKGYRVFQQHCNRCHREPLFSTYELSRNGLPVDSVLRDLGRYRVTKLAADSFLFKVPSLRNLSYSYPYMHDGRYKKLRQVLAHYAQGPVPGGRIDLTEEEKTELIAFLLTLDDRQFVFNKKFREANR